MRKDEILKLKRKLGDRVGMMQARAKVRYCTWDLETPYGTFRVSFTYEKVMAERTILVHRLGGSFGGTSRRFQVVNRTQRPCKNMAFVAINWFLDCEHAAAVAKAQPRPKNPNVPKPPLDDRVAAAVARSKTGITLKDVLAKAARGEQVQPEDFFDGK